MNTRTRKTGSSLLLLLLPLILLILAAGPVSAKPFELMILFTNDTNGHPLSFTYNEDQAQGGIPARATLINKLTGGNKKKANAIILDAGGIIMGRPESNLFFGATDAAGMSKIEYDAAGIGISELYHGIDVFDDFNEKCDFYLLNSNITNSETKETIADPYLVLKVGGGKGVKVGIFAVITDEAGHLVSKDAQKEISVSDAIKSAQKTVLELKKEKVDYIIALTYLGYFPDDQRAGSKTLAASVDGIDLIIDGRTGVKLEEAVVINNTRIVQAFKWGLFLGDVRVKFEDKKVTDVTYTLHPVNYKENGQLVGEALEDDPKVYRAISGKMRNMDKMMKERIAKLNKGKFDPTTIRYEENTLGNMICDAMLDYTGADIALQNAGGISQKIIESSKITRTTFDELIKYDNSLFLVNLTGSDIRKILGFSVQRAGYGSFLQVAGIRFTWSKSTYELSNITVKGRPLEDDTIYKVVINSWLAQGGDGYTLIRDQPNKDDLYILHREVVYNYLKKLKTVEPMLDGRINVID